ncbi:TRAP transporter substrate-binding protein DctP [Paracoccus saliphilus]|uniref:TRAP transporter substrate-binding protein DctP n=1 Tax=Paracoccus saliphilus TaxID=405559 RepID=A0AA46A4S2_9RHOB|nr:TRAP transporter substrate-binding protein DctP [Paracoccus saliphilus]WCR01472.1 TRAP transporter substrate-binding protein DctP [Paracoccus saliphilus]SIS69025.1 TRAP-type C4-dicarboxylate transport system, substrate-binding protein [Paracoccus saliphilus]
MSITRKQFLKTFALGGAAAMSGLAAPTVLRAQSPVLLRMNLVVSNQDPSFPMWQDFGKRIEEAAEGTLKVEVYPTETLGKTNDMIEAVSRGAPILQDSDPTHLYNYKPDFAAMMAPYLVKKPEDIGTLWNSDLVRGWEEEVQAQGIRVLTMTYFGTRHLLSNRQVEKRTDTQGLKIRNAPTKMWNEVGRVLGGIITNTAFSEAYTALSQGVADGAESPLSVIYSTKWFETKPYISLTGHLVATTSILMSQKVYDDLPEAAQKALDTVGRGYTAVRQPQIIALEDEYRGKLEEAGLTFNDVDRESFFAAAAETPDHFPEWTPGLYDKINEIIG